MNRDRLWDFVIIGSGIGGGTAAYALARTGKTVLLIERGRARPSNGATLYGGERVEKADDQTAAADLLKSAGLFWEEVDDVTRATTLPFQPYVGNGVGGSSGIYGMAMERFRPEDFSPGQFAESTEANVPEQWPIAYSEIAPYYVEAERLYRVRGTPDPLRPREASYGYSTPPPLSPSNAEIARVLASNGLHPYYHPMACEYQDGCRECLAQICPLGCKNDSFKCCIDPAIREFGANLLDESEVVHLEADHACVKVAHCIRHGERFTIKAKTFILGAGALQTPALLLRSQNSDWPRGLANRQDQVGRNFMKHFIDYYFVRTSRAWRPGELTKQISFNDFYLHGPTKLGNVQSLGPAPPLDKAVIHFERGLIQWSPRLKSALPLIRPAVKLAARQTMQRSLVFASILEDLPYADNRVTYDRARSRICLNYRIHEEAKRRLRCFRSLTRNAFKPLPTRLLRLAHNSWILGHQVGTCRFGTKAQNSVLDRQCRAHDLENLIVVDGSFMPTSGGINPSLTIAANALRVAAELS